jgi:hypothetical protein
MERNEYNTSLNNISNRIAVLGNHELYSILEADWSDYFEHIFRPNRNPELQIRIITCESGPENIDNYMFSSVFLDNIIVANTDKYLQQIYTGVFPHVNNNALPTRRNALIELAQQNVVILDILPTHGIKLNPTERRRIAENVTLGIYQIEKILDLEFIPNITLNYVFAVPPSLYLNNNLQNLLPDNFIERGNINIGQGHAPSRYALQNLIDNNLF